MGSVNGGDHVRVDVAGNDHVNDHVHVPVLAETVSIHYLR